MATSRATFTPRLELGFAWLVLALGMRVGAYLRLRLRLTRPVPMRVSDGAAFFGSLAAGAFRRQVYTPYLDSLHPYMATRTTVGPRLTGHAGLTPLSYSRAGAL